MSPSDLVTGATAGLYDEGAADLSTLTRTLSCQRFRSKIGFYK